MPLEMPFEMRNLTSFQMEKLYYDLKLEVLKEMDAKDTIELAKVNKGFQWMLSGNPWLVFDHHVYEIQLVQSYIWLFKFPGSSWFEFNATHRSLSKRIRSCDKLWIDLRSDEQFGDEEATILNQLNSVKHLTVSRKSEQCWPKFLETFRSVVEESVWLGLDIGWENQGTAKLFENFLSNQANGCKIFHFEGDSTTFHFFYDAFAKTSIKFMSMSTYEDDFCEIVQSIVKKQIPDKNLGGSFCVLTFYSPEVNAQIVDFLSQFRGMQRFDRENEAEVIRMATEHLKNHRALGKEHVDLMQDTLFFRRNIDSSRDCVYMLQKCSGDGLRFLAFHIRHNRK